MFKQFKHLAATALAIAAVVPAMGQSVDSPLPVNTTGENYYDVGETYESVYYSYTSEVGQYVYFTGLRVNNITYQQGNTTTSVSYASWKTPYNTMTIFYAEAGTEYILTATTSTDTYIRFTFSSEEAPYNNGRDPENPIIAGACTYLPCGKTGTSFWDPTADCYANYTAPEGGKLVVTFYGGKPNEMYYSTLDQNNIKIEPSYTSATQNYRAAIQVEAGQVISFRFKNSSPVVGFFGIEEVIPGASMEDYFICADGANVIPAAAGNYWYTFMTPAYPSQSIVTVTSEATATMDFCGSGGSSIQLFNALHMRYSIPSDSRRYLIIHKSEATATDETFNFEMTAPTAYDVIQTGPTIESGAETSTPDFGGTYYYSIEAPASGAWFLDMDFATDLQAAACDFYVYDNPTGYYKSYGASIHMEAVNGTKYYIRVVVPYTMDGAAFTATFNAIQPGETASNPIAAEVGQNPMSNSRDLYYSYTPATNCWVNLSVTGASLPSVMESGAMVTTLPVSDNTFRFEAEAGKTYVLNFKNVPAGASFNISEVPYAEGESYETAFEAELGSNVLPSAAGKTWYKYTATGSDFVIVTTTLPFSYSTTIAMYVNQVTSANRVTMDYNYDYYLGNSWSQIKQPVAAGDICYILVETTTAREDGASITLTTEPIGPGMAASTAIPMNLEFNEEGIATFAIPETSSEIWYSFEIPIDALLSGDTASSLSAKVYSHDGTTEVGSLGWSGFTNQSVTAGTFYLKVVYNYNAGNLLTLSYRIPGPGEGMSTAYEIPVTGDPTTYDFPYNGGYSGPTVWYSMDLNEGTLSMDCSAWMISGSVYDSNNNYMSSISEERAAFGVDHYGFVNLTIPAAGRYYLRFTNLTPNGYMSDPNAVATSIFTGSALDMPQVSVEEFEAEEAAPEYYTLNGTRVNGRPEAGLYIVRRGAKVSKVIIR